MSPMARHAWLALPLILFLSGALTGLESHGLYMDGVNPDYLVARWLGEARTEIRPWVLPGNLLLGRFPLLIQLYHGALPFWLGLPGYLLLGTDVAAVRMVHAGFGLLVLGGLYAFLMAFGARRMAAIAALCVLALDPSFLLAFRTQFYITLLPLAFVLASAALTECCGGRWAKLAAGFCAGLAVYGYFIHGMFLPVLLIHAALRMRERRDAQGFCLWLLGAALGGTPYPLGYAAAAASYGFMPAALVMALAWLGGLGFLAWLTTRGRPLRWLALATGLGVLALMIGASTLPRASLLAPLTQHLASLEPGRSILTWGERVALLAGLARLALDGGGEAVLLHAAMPGGHAALRLWLLLAILTLGAAALLWRRSPGWARGPLLVLGLMAAHLPLALAFGDRLWVQHLVAMPVLLAALLGLALQAQRGRLAVLALLVLPLGVPLGALGAWDRHAVLRELERTGGVGLASDAITRFSREVARTLPNAVVRAPDWGVSMPFVMITGGRVAIQPDAPPAAMQADLCAGRPVVLVLLAQGAEARMAAFAGTLGPARIARYEQRDGRPVLVSASWLPPNACGARADAATNPATAPAPAGAR